MKKKQLTAHYYFSLRRLHPSMLAIRAVKQARTWLHLDVIVPFYYT